MAEKPEDLSLPASVVARIIKDSVQRQIFRPDTMNLWLILLKVLYCILQLPEGVSVSKEARVAIGKAASVFILYCTAW